MYTNCSRNSSQHYASHVSRICLWWISLFMHDLAFGMSWKEWSKDMVMDSYELLARHVRGEALIFHVGTDLLWLYCGTREVFVIHVLFLSFACHNTSLDNFCK